MKGSESAWTLDQMKRFEQDQLEHIKKYKDMLAYHEEKLYKIREYICRKENSGLVVIIIQP